MASHLPPFRRGGAERSEEADWADSTRAGRPAVDWPAGHFGRRRAPRAAVKFLSFLGRLQQLGAARTSSKACRVPRYYFDTFDGHISDCDQEGLDLEDDLSAQRMAWSCLAEVLADLAGPPAVAIVISIRDEHRGLVFEVVAKGERRMSQAAP